MVIQGDENNTVKQGLGICSPFVRVIELIGYVMDDTPTGILTDLAENLFTVFFFSSEFSNYQIFLTFMLLDIWDKVVDEGMSVCFPKIGALLKFAAEWVQCGLFIYFCGFTRNSIIFFVIIAFFQSCAQLTSFFEDEEAAGKSEERMAFEITQCCCGPLSIVIIDILGWVYTFGSPINPYSSTNFQALLTVYLWAAVFAEDLKKEDAQKQMSTLTAGEIEPGLQTTKCDLKHILNLFASGYCIAFQLVAFSYGVENLHDANASKSDRGLYTYSIVLGSFLIFGLGCFACTLSMMACGSLCMYAAK